ncbi:uncharacterized protein LOC126742052 [Anthonomus grandis grandis]|uniref:uncharacterized protein LOC126742052 n=1 Tax=Anthonomus grandis grandis TaxID=2921223 RepID=UPI0021656D6F|nr:uncharacterized protein LOC126742052 [Anthonomus grandis grandis]
MASKSFALFLCVLALSPLAHAWIVGKESLELNAQRLDSPIFKLIKGVKDNLGDLSKLGDLSDETATKPHELKGVTANPIQYYGPANNPDVIAICDSVGGICLIVDISVGICLLCNGDGTGIVINCELNVALYVPLGVWNASNNDLKSFIDNCNLSTIYDLTTNDVINQSNPGTTVLNICLKVMGGLDVETNQTISADLTSALSVTISICSRIVVLLSVDLKGLLDLTCSAFVTLTGDLSCLLAVLDGLVLLIDSAATSLAELLSASIVIVLEVLLTASDGCKALVEVLLVIGVSFDLTILLGDVATDIGIFLNICVLLGGGVYTGLNGVVRILDAVVGLVTELIDLDACLLIIIRVCVNITGVSSISATITAILNLISWQVGNWNNAAGWSTLLNFFMSLQNETCVVAGINISGILTLVLAGIVTTVLDLVVRVVLLLSVFVSVTITSVNVYWATLIRVIFFLLNSITGRIIINVLIPGLNIVINLLTGCLNLLGGLVGLTLALVLSTLNLLGLVAAIVLVPILNTIWTLVSSVISAIVGLNLEAALNAVPSEKALIQNWIPTITTLGC